MNELADSDAAIPITISRSHTRAIVGRQRLWVLLAIFAVAAGLRVSLFDRSGLWTDEIFSLAIATGHSLEHPAAAAQPKLGDFVEPDHPVPAQELNRYVEHQSPLETPARVVRAVVLSDTNPPLYYLLLYGWTLILGTSDMALRLFSTACSLACFPFIVGIARRTGGKAAVLPACVLFCVSPIAIYYSVEGRMYSLLWLFVLALAWISLVIRQGRGRIGFLALWVLTSTAGFLTHYFFIFPWSAIVVYLMARPGRLKRMDLLWCIVVTGALLIPWYINLPAGMARWRITKDWLKFPPPDYSMLDSLRRMVYMFFAGWDKRLWLGYRWSNIMPVLPFGVIGGLMLWKMRSRALARGRLLLGLLFFAGCAGPFVFDLVQRTYTIAWPRYAISALPAVYLLAAAGLACLPRRASAILLGLVILTWVPNLIGLSRTRFWWAPPRTIAEVASRNRTASDLILIHSIPSGFISIARYVQGPAPLASWIEQLGNRQVPDSLHSLARGRTSVIFVKVHEAGSLDPEADWLRAHANVAGQTPVGLVKIIDFRPRGSKTF